MISLDSFRPIYILALVIAILLSVYSAPGPSHAAGLTTHWYIGGLAKTEVRKKDKNLANLLAEENVWYRRGTTFPDAAIEYLIKKKASESAQDNESHNDESSDGGFFSKYLDEYRKTCGTDFNKLMKANSGHCREALAFFFGMINHVIADAPWHATWIAKTTGKYCPKVEQKWGGNEFRHGIADTDIDICLSSRLNGNSGNITNTVSWSTAKASKAKPQFLCASGQFYSLAKGGSCWSCPSGYRSSGLPGDSKLACVTGQLKKGTRHAKSIAGICPKGQWNSFDNGYCYSCPKNYLHDSIKSGGTTGACFTPSGTKKAKGHGAPRIGCPKGEFGQAGKSTCYACPSGYSHDAAYTVDKKEVCKRKVTAPCSKIKLPILTQLLTGNMYGKGIDQKKAAWDMVATAKSPAKKVITDLLNKAYKAQGHEVVADKINDEMDKFYLNAIKEPLATLNDTKNLILGTHNADALTEHAGSCDGAFEHVMDKNAKGAIPDSAHESSKAMLAIWSGLKTSNLPIFVRTGSFNYHVKVGNKKTYCYGDGC